jgi:hypothetical protein
MVDLWRLAYGRDIYRAFCFDYLVYRVDVIDKVDTVLVQV